MDRTSRRTGHSERSSTAHRSLLMPCLSSLITSHQTHLIDIWLHCYGACKPVINYESVEHGTLSSLHDRLLYRKGRAIPASLVMVNVCMHHVDGEF